MKQIILISSLAASALVLTACNSTTRESTSSYDESTSSLSAPTMAPVAADSRPASSPAADSSISATSSSSSTLASEPLPASSSSTAPLSDPSVSPVPSAAPAPVNPNPADSSSLSAASQAAPAPMAPTAPVLTDNTAPIASQAPDAAATDHIAGRIQEWKLSAAEIQNDLDSGKVISRSASNGSINEPVAATVDGFMLSSMVKGRLAADRQLAGVDIQAESSGSEIKLSGSVGSAELVGRAIAIALDTRGVTVVTSNLKVSTPSP